MERTPMRHIFQTPVQRLKEKEELEKIIEANYQHLESVGSITNRTKERLQAIRTPKVATTDSSTSPRSTGRPKK